MAEDTEETVVYIFFNRYSNHVLLEKRTNKPEHRFFGQEIYPGGSKKTGESDEKAVFREIAEELGSRINITGCYKLRLAEDVFGESGKRLIPYVVTDWEGEIPERVLDSGNTLVWKNLQETAQNSPLESTRRLSLALIQFIATRS